MELLRDFTKLGKNDTSLAGGKGASLGEMTKMGILVPPGFVILSNAFENFLEETDLNVEIDAILDSINHREIHTVEGASEKIKSLIMQAEMPQDIAVEIQKFFKKLNSKYTAVRSSATAEDSVSAAWAGQLESYLNTTEENLLENVKQCWASLFTPRAIFYRFEKDLHKQKIFVAVVVQKMIESEKSGVAFSVHPVTQDRNQLIIEAGLGLGEAIVSGQITPDSYVIEKQPRRIIDKNIQTQSKGLYRAKGGGNEWRDISIEIGGKQVLSDSEILELSGLVLKIEKHFGFPCDIEWAFENGIFFTMQSRPITTLRAEVTSGQNNKSNNLLTPEDFRDSIRLSAQAYPLFHSCCYQWSKKRANKYYTGFTEIAIKYIDGVCHLIVPRKVFILRGREILQEILYGKEIFHVEVDKTEKEIKKFISYSQKIRKISVFKYFDRFAELFGRALALMYPFEYAADEWIKNFEKIHPELKNDFVCACSPTEQSFMQQEEIALEKLNRKLRFVDGKEKINKLIEKHIKSWGWTNNSYAGRKIITIENIKERIIKIAAVGEIKTKTIETKNTLPKDAKHLAIEIAKVFSVRDLRKKLNLIGVGVINDLIDKIGVDLDSVKWLTFEEFSNLDKNFKLAKKYREAKSRFIYLRDGKSFNITAEQYNELEKISFEENKTIKIIGASANAGVAKGKVKIIFSERDFSKMQNGDILVASMTRPEYAPIIKQASAIVTDEGGVTCHAAIISREMNIPCIIGTKIATKILRDGDLVYVDANKGIVKILK